MAGHPFRSAKSPVKRERAVTQEARLPWNNSCHLLKQHFQGWKDDYEPDFLGDKMNLILVWILVMSLLSVSREKKSVICSEIRLQCSSYWLLLWPFLSRFLSQHAAAKHSGKFVSVLLKVTFENLNLCDDRPLKVRSGACLKQILIWQTGFFFFKFHILFMWFFFPSLFFFQSNTCFIINIKRLFSIKIHHTVGVKTWV